MQNIAVPTTSLQQATVVPHNPFLRRTGASWGASSPLTQEQRIPARQVCSPLGTAQSGRATLTYRG